MLLFVKEMTRKNLRCNANRRGILMKYNDLIPEFIVSNIEKSKYFYVNLLGFKIEYEREEHKFAFLSLNQIQLMIEQGDSEALAKYTYPFGQGVNFTFGVKNVEEIYQRVKEANYPIQKEIEKRSFRVGDEVVTPTEFAVLDPDGYYIRVSD